MSVQESSRSTNMADSSLFVDMDVGVPKLLFFTSFVLLLLALSRSLLLPLSLTLPSLSLEAASMTFLGMEGGDGEYVCGW